MKKRLVILLLAILTLTCVLTACADKAVTSVELVGFDKLVYGVGDSIDYDSLKIKVTFEDGSTQEMTVAEAKKELKATVVPADFSKAGETAFGITVGGKTISVTITVDSAVLPADAEVQTFTLPQFLANHANRANPQSESAASFLRKNQPYEVGNVNKFIVEPTVTALVFGNGSATEATQTKGVETTLALRVSEDGSTWSAVADADLATYVTKDGNAYQFTEDAAGLYFEMTISLADSYTLADNEVASSRKQVIKVVDGGYNVYDQWGLSVMSDIVHPIFWAELWNVDVTVVPENGAFTISEKSGSAPKQLDADDHPLYKYVGYDCNDGDDINVTSIVLHGDILLNADLLPANFFWDATIGRDGKADSNLYKWHGDGRRTLGTISHKDSYDAALASLTGKESQYANALNGSLIDGDGYGEQCDGEFDIHTRWYTNSNKALYSSAKVSISGNYCSVTVPSITRDADGKITDFGRSAIYKRTLMGVVSADSAKRSDDPWNQWHVFAMLEPAATVNAPVAEFYIKNLSSKGTTGQSELTGPKGLNFIQSYSKNLIIDNVNAEAYCTQVSGDNLADTSSLEISSKITISHSKITDAYSAIAIAWRTSIDVVASKVCEAGGPVFIMMDGTDVAEGETRNVPTLTIDDASEVYSWTMGGEAWYKQQGEITGELFGYLKNLNDQAILPSFGKTLVHYVDESAPTTGYFNAVALFMTDGGHVFDLDGSNFYVPRGQFAVNKAGTKQVLFDMRGDFVGQMIRSLNVHPLVVKSGPSVASQDEVIALQNAGSLNYAYYDFTNFANPLADSMKQVAAITALAQQGVTNPTEEQIGQAMAQISDATIAQAWANSWKTTSNEYLSMWLPVGSVSQNPESPYLGLVLGNFEAYTTE